MRAVRKTVTKDRVPLRLVSATKKWLELASRNVTWATVK